MPEKDNLTDDEIWERLFDSQMSKDFLKQKSKELEKEEQNIDLSQEDDFFSNNTDNEKESKKIKNK